MIQSFLIATFFFQNYRRLFLALTFASYTCSYNINRSFRPTHPRCDLPAKEFSPLYLKVLEKFLFSACLPLRTFIFTLCLNFTKRCHPFLLYLCRSTYSSWLGYSWRQAPYFRSSKSMQMKRHKFSTSWEANLLHFLIAPGISFAWV